jgi:acyl dehydratase
LLPELRLIPAVRHAIHNQHGQLVLDGEHTYLLKTAQHSTSAATS